MNSASLRTRQKRACVRSVSFVVHTHIYFQECEPHNKTIDAGLRAPDAFARYTAGELVSETRKKRLMVCTPEEKKEKTDRALQRRKASLERRRARREGDGQDFDDEYYDSGDDGRYDTTDQEEIDSE